MYSRTPKSCGCTGKSNATVAGKTVRRDAFPGTPSAGQRRIADERAAHAHNIRLLTVKDFLRGFHDAYTPHHDDGNIELGMKTAGDVSKVAASFRSIAINRFHGRIHGFFPKTEAAAYLKGGKTGRFQHPGGDKRQFRRKTVFYSVFRVYFGNDGVVFTADGMYGLYHFHGKARSVLL